MENNGYFSSYGTIWSTRCDDDSIRIFYLEVEQVHTGNSNVRTRPRLQEVGRYFNKTDRSAKESTNGATKA